MFVKLTQRPELLAMRDERAFLLRLAHNLAIDPAPPLRDRNYNQLGHRDRPTLSRHRDESHRRAQRQMGTQSERGLFT